MKWQDNTVESIIKAFKNDLANRYEEEEIKNFLHLLFFHYKNWNQADLILSKKERLSESEILNFHFAAKRLLEKEPIQYIIGFAFFDDLYLKVNNNTLIPRQETEELVVLVDSFIKSKKIEKARIIDIGTGSGAIALALKKRIPNSEVVAIDFSEKALEIAKENAKKNDLKIDFRLIDVLNDDVSDLGKFDIVVSNPPYIKFDEKTLMQENVLNYEPHSALFVENDNPFVFYNKIVEKFNASTTLAFFFEINEFLGKEIKQNFENQFDSVGLIKDLQEKDRFLVLKK
jgi:release factor glutamine methyltransferase